MELAANPPPRHGGAILSYPISVAKSFFDKIFAENCMKMKEIGPSVKCILINK